MSLSYANKWSNIATATVNTGKRYILYYNIVTKGLNVTTSVVKYIKGTFCITA